MQAERSRRDTFITVSAVASSSSSSSSRPMRIRPSAMAMVAGTAPSSRTAASSARAVSRLRGRGRPWAISVLSRATIGRPALRAAATSALKASKVCMAPSIEPQGRLAQARDAELPVSPLIATAAASRPIRAAAGKSSPQSEAKSVAAASASPAPVTSRGVTGSGSSRVKPEESPTSRPAAPRPMTTARAPNAISRRASAAPQSTTASASLVTSRSTLPEPVPELSGLADRDGVDSDQGRPRGMVEEMDDAGLRQVGVDEPGIGGVSDRRTQDRPAPAPR